MAQPVISDGQPEPDAPLVRSRVVRGVAMVALNAQQGTGLVPSLCAAVTERIAALVQSPSVAAIVLLAEGAAFAGGAVPEDEDGARALADLCLRIEASPKPVVAVLTGPVLAGGAELVLAAHFRLAVPAATFGLPGIAVGLVPGAGGTPRLTRLVGVEPALGMILSGKPVAAATARSLGLIDGLITGDAASGGHAFARSLVDAGTLPRPVSRRRDRIADGAAALRAVALARAALPASAVAALRRAVDCVEAAVLLPFAAAVAFEVAARAECLADPDSGALCHLARATPLVSPDLLGPGGVTSAGQAVVAALLDAQDRAIGWLVATGVPEAAVDAAFADWGFARLPFGTAVSDAAIAPDPQVRPRVTAALAAAGAVLVMRGAVARASDVDVLAVRGMGFPPRAGGPMKAAETAGLPRLVRQMRDWAEDDPVWFASPLLEQAARFAGGFAAVTRG